MEVKNMCDNLYTYVRLILCVLSIVTVGEPDDLELMS